MLRVWLRLLPLLLFFMADSGDGDGGDGDSSDSDSDANAGGKQGGKSDSGGDAKPYATFPDADSFAARMDREAKQRLAKQAEELGYESVDDMLAAAKAKREADDQAKSDAEKAREEADRAKNESKTALERANARVVRAEARVVASDLGIKGERIAHAIKLADLDGVEVSDDGDPDTKAIRTALEAVLKDIPELKADAAASNGGAEFNGQGEPPGQKDLKGALADRLKIS